MLHAAGADAFGAGRRVAPPTPDRPGPDAQRPRAELAAVVRPHRVLPYVRAARDAGDLTRPRSP